MRKIKLLNLLAITVLGTTVMYGQASRTWVSGVGDDANPCSRTAPCKTFAGAISKTAAGGEIDALDPAGYGAVTITKAITIDGGGGQVASVLVSGTNGIVVQAGPSDVVILRNLRINGIGTGINGIRFLSGKDLNVESCYIFGFTTNGVDIALNQATAASAHILNTVIKNNGGVGVRAANAVSPAVAVVVDSSSAILNNIGVEAAQHAHVTVSRSLVSKNANDGLKSDDAATSDAQLTVSFTDSDLNKNGVTAAPGGTANVAFSNIGLNTTCGFNNAGGTSFFTFGNNRLTGTGFCGTITPIPQQ
ncbi:MAG TPA: hypothetical protein VHW72_21950 [Candidatus Angelobacter sp.]|jgi:hypothetical protein|nr:hypothetical protein [Candidatus Angelobacter sp.]